MTASPDGAIRRPRFLPTAVASPPNDRQAVTASGASAPRAAARSPPAAVGKSGDSRKVPAIAGRDAPAMSRGAGGGARSRRGEERRMTPA